MALAVSSAVGRPAPRGLWWTAVGLSVLPDLDVVGFAFGVRYEDTWGHRGMTHSLLFAAIVGTAVALAWWKRRPDDVAHPARLAAFFVAVLASHGLLDAMTDGGLGIAFFSPFDRTRYFLPLRPIHVSPLGLGAFLSSRGLRVLTSEALWVWLPAALLVAIARLARRRRSPDGA